MKAFYQLIKSATLKKIAIIAMLFFSVQRVSAVCNINPNFTYQQNGNDIIFTALHTQGSSTQYFWNFGDNNFGYTKQTNHTFRLAGTYNVVLFVADSIGNSCDTSSIQIITITNSLPCNVLNDSIEDTIYLSANSNSRSYCLPRQSCFVSSIISGINNTVHGSLSNLNNGCINYTYNSIGTDTFTVFLCDSVQGLCKSTFFSINILPLSLCNILDQDTIYLTLDTTYYGSYYLSSIYDSSNMQFHPFVLEEWSNINITLTPNRLFDSIIQLYRYMDSTANGIFNFDGNYTIYSTNANARDYLNQPGLKIFIPFNAQEHLIGFNFQSIKNANYCSSLQYAKYFFENGWQYLGFCSPNNISFNFNQNGVFNFTIRDSITNCIDNVVFIVGNSQSLCDTITCLLPGDADHDLTVNNYDVLALGLSYNRVGIARPNATTQYTLQASPDWSTTHYYGYNDKFADCNGDGIISATDATVINQNYIIQPQNIFNHRRNNTDTLPTITLVFDTLPTAIVNGNCVGAQLVADINVGEATQQIIDGYGVAFSVNYPFENDSCFSVQVDLDPNSWFQTNNPVLLFYKNIPEYSRVDISVVRTDGTPRSGNGRIGNIKMITEGGIFGLYKNSSSINFDFSVTDAVMIDNLGNKIDINGSSTSVNFVVAGIKENKVDGLRIFPNPTKNIVFINAREAIQTAKILDLSGRVIFENSFNKNNVELDFSSIENGMYIIEIKGNNSVSYEKIFKQ